MDTVIGIRIGDGIALVVDVTPGMTAKYAASVQRLNGAWLHRLAGIYEARRERSRHPENEAPADSFH